VRRKATEPISRRAIIYTRVSTEEQVHGGISLDAQVAGAVGWCERNGYAAEVCQIFTDAGVSGKRADNRPQLAAALKACRKGDALVVYSLSRLARSTKDAIEISEKLGAVGADLVSLTENLDTTTATGKMIFGVLAVLAQFERDLISERTSAALKHKRRVGEEYSRPVYGFDAVEGRLHPCQAEQAIIAEVNQMRGAGHSYAAIAETLTERRVRTKRNGQCWYASTVRSILSGDRQAA
jgi:site-specific DNA recombinase